MKNKHIIIPLLFICTIMTSLSAAAQPSTTLYKYNVLFASRQYNDTTGRMMYMDVKEASHDNLVPIIVWPRDTSQLNQSFSLYSYPDGTVDIRAEHSGMCIDVFNAGIGLDVPVIQFVCNGDANQRFYLEQLSTGGHQLRAKHSDFCLVARSCGDILCVKQWYCAGTAATWYYILPYPP